MKQDKRIRYTKMFLKESLIKKLKEKPISRITVTELSEDAEINRATFYAHYSDQFDLLQQIEQDFISDISQKLNSVSNNPEKKGLLIITEQIIQYIAENKELCQVLFGENGTINFQQNIAKKLSDPVISIITKDKPFDSNITADLYSFISGGSIELIRKWLFSTNDDRTPEELASLIVKIVNEGVSGFIQV